MGIGPAKAEGVNPYNQTLALRQTLSAGYNTQIEPLEIDARVRFVEMQVWRNAAMLEHKQRLGPTGDGRSRLKMSQIAFHRSNRQRLVLGTGLAEHLAERPSFNRIPDSRSGSMGLQIVQVLGPDAGLGINLAQQIRLRLPTRHCDSRSAPIAIDPTAFDHRKNPIPVGERLFKRFEQQNSPSLGSHVAISGRIESPAATASRKHPRLCERQETQWVKMQTHPTRESTVRIT